MPTAVYSSGPAAIIVGQSRGYGIYQFGTPGIYPQGNFPQAPSILGWCERSPQLDVSGAYTPLFNTLGGVELPYTYLYQGTEGQITCTMTKWDDYVLHLIENLYVLGQPVVYQSIPMQFRALYVIVLYPMWAAAGDIVPPSPHAWIDVYPLCRVARIEKRDQGTMPAKVTVVFHAMRGHVYPSPAKAAVSYNMGAMDLGAHGGFSPNDATSFGGQGAGFASLAALALAALGLVPAAIP
jgi:hypothetical protein